MEKILLSIYYHHKVNEKEEFFDAWWQFYHTISYLACMLFIILCHVLIYVLGIANYNPMYSAIPFAANFIVDLFAKEFRSSTFHYYITENYNTIEPIKKSILNILGLLVIVLLVLSFKFVT